MSNNTAVIRVVHGEEMEASEKMSEINISRKG